MNMYGQQPEARTEVRQSTIRIPIARKSICDESMRDVRWSGKRASVGPSEYSANQLGCWQTTCLEQGPTVSDRDKPSCWRRLIKLGALSSGNQVHNESSGGTWLARPPNSPEQPLRNAHVLQLAIVQPSSVFVSSRSSLSARAVSSISCRGTWQSVLSGS
jgi:hypothetical protein